MNSSRQPETTRQVFYGDVENVAGRDVVNHIHHDQGRALTGQERVELNDKVKRLHEQYGEHGGKTWKFLHRTIGVENIEAMCLGHRDSAHAILDLLLERAERQRKNTEQSVELDANASAITKLQQQASALSTQLKSSSAREQQYQHQLGEAHRQIELLRQSRPARPLCQTCDTATRHLARSRRRLAMMTGAVVLAMLAGLYLGFEAYSARKATQAAEVRLQNCEFEQKQYRLGSVLDRPQGADLKCVATNGKPAEWQEVPHPVAKAKPIKSVRKKPKSVPAHRSVTEQSNKPTTESPLSGTVAEQLF